jgi:hypothetical protein
VGASEEFNAILLPNVGLNSSSCHCKCLTLCIAGELSSGRNCLEAVKDIYNFSETRIFPAC